MAVIFELLCIVRFPTKVSVVVLSCCNVVPANAKSLITVKLLIASVFVPANDAFEVIIGVTLSSNINLAFVILSVLIIRTDVSAIAEVIGVIPAEV